MLLKHLAKINIYEGLPSNEENSKEAAVSRIKYYRNQICHTSTGQTTEKDFHKIWDLIVYKVFDLFI